MSRSSAAPLHSAVRKSDLFELMRLSGPVVLSRLGIMLMGLTDAVVVGRSSVEQLSFHAMAWAPSSVFLTTAVGLLVGAQVMASRAVGSGNLNRAGAVLRRGLVYAFWIGVAAALGLAVLGPALLHAANLPKSMIEGSTGPLLIFALSLPLYAPAAVISFWLEGLSRPTPATLAMWAANAVNLGVDLLLVPGAFGIPRLGAVGAAWSTLVARAALLLLLAIAVIRLKDARAMGVFDKPAHDRAAETAQRRVGFAAGASNFIQVAAFAGMSVVAGWIGGLSVAAWAVVFNVSGIIFMAPLGIAAATSVRVGRAYGARDQAGVSRAGWVSFGFTAFVGLILAALLFALRSHVASGYTSDMRAQGLIAPALALICLSLTPDALQVVATQALRARGDVWTPTLAHLVGYGLVMAPLAWWLALQMKLGLGGIIWSVAMVNLITAVFLVARFWLLDLQAGLAKPTARQTGRR